MEFKRIDLSLFNKDKKDISNWVQKIWTRTLEDSRIANETISKYFKDNLSGYYFLIIDMDNGRIIWITWYHTIDWEKWIFWLKHYWILPEYRWKWLWKKLLKKLFSIIEDDWHKNLKWIVELIPNGAVQIEQTFLKMWFIDNTKKLSIYPWIQIRLNTWYYEKAYIFSI